MLNSAKANAPALGITWKGLNIVVKPERAGGPLAATSEPASLACRSDAIVVGHPVLSRSHLSAAATTIYTDYDFVIDRIVKDNASSSLTGRQDLVVTRLGGEVTLDAGPLRYDHNAFPRLQANTTYLLFLQSITETGAYQSVDPYSTFVSLGKYWTRLSGISRVETTEFETQTFLSDITLWTAGCKNHK
jgi:hypothetical protein